MTIVVVGPGAMGCLFAGLLAETQGRAGHGVWLLDKDSARSRDIAASGVRIDTGSESRVIKVNITTEPGTIGTADILFLFVKAYDTDHAMRHAMSLVGAQTTVVSLQNGAGSVEQVTVTVKESAIVRGVTSHGSTSLGTGHVRHAGSGPTVVAPVEPSGKKRAVAVADLLTSAGIDTKTGDNWRELVWNKLIINAAINPLAAVSNVPNGRLIEDENLRKILHEAASEAIIVARAKGIRVHNSAGEVEEVCRKTSENISSMLQDIRNGRRTEIDSITGIVVREARELGINVPVNEMLLTRVRKMEEDRAKAGDGGKSCP